MESWNQNKDSQTFFDPYRQKQIKNRPEELIRQALLHKMIHELGYPKGLITLEKNLHALPHVSLSDRKIIPNRRLDILVFAKNIHPQHALFPLLIIECKAENLTPKSTQQLIGYNDVVQAPFIALANQSAVFTGHYVKGTFQFVEGLFPFEHLLIHLTQKEKYSALK